MSKGLQRTAGAAGAVVESFFAGLGAGALGPLTAEMLAPQVRWTVRDGRVVAMVPGREEILRLLDELVDDGYGTELLALGAHRDGVVACHSECLPGRAGRRHEVASAHFRLERGRIVAIERLDGGPWLLRAMLEPRVGRAAAAV